MISLYIHVFIQLQNIKVVAFNGSPRRNGNTVILIKELFRILQTEGIQTEMILVGNKPGDVLTDKEGMQTMKTLGENMAWLLKKIN